MWEKAWICRYTHTHNRMGAKKQKPYNFDTKYKERIQLQATLEEHAISLKKILLHTLMPEFRWLACA